MNAAVSVIDAVNGLASIDVSIVRWLPYVGSPKKHRRLLRVASQAEMDIGN
jgi:hypothetical protein